MKLAPLLLGLMLLTSRAEAGTAQLAITWAIDCAAPPGTIVGQIWYPFSGYPFGGFANRVTFSYTGDSSFALDSTGSYLVVGPSGISPADCGTAVPITLTGVADPPCAQNFVFDWSDATGCDAITVVVQ